MQLFLLVKLLFIYLHVALQNTSRISHSVTCKFILMECCRDSCSNEIIITVQYGSADTVVKAMNVKYRKWRLGGVVL